MQILSLTLAQSSLDGLRQRSYIIILTAFVFYKRHLAGKPMNVLFVFIQKSKTDQTRFGHTVVLGMNILKLTHGNARSAISGPSPRKETKELNPFSTKANSLKSTLQKG